MRAPRCTIDSSCVIALDHLDLLPRLSFLFSRVLVPKAVRVELFKRRTTKDRMRSYFETYAFFEACDGYERGTVDFLLAERKRRGMKDRGEVEAVVQASPFGATVIVDDQWGRELAAKYNLDHHGTVWVLHQLHELRLMASPDLRTSFSRLREHGSRLPWKTVNVLLKEIGEKPV